MIPKKIQKKILDTNAADDIADSEINKAEDILGVEFHADYKWILERFRYLDDDHGNIISGLAIHEQSENVIYLNKEILKSKSIPNAWTAISYENIYDKVLVLDNITGNIYAYDYDMSKGEMLFTAISSLLEKMFCSSK